MKEDLLKLFLNRDSEAEVVMKMIGHRIVMNVFVLNVE